MSIKNKKSERLSLFRERGNWLFSKYFIRLEIKNLKLILHSPCAKVNVNTLFLLVLENLTTIIL
jgi:hypothetical protein